MRPEVLLHRLHVCNPRRHFLVSESPTLCQLNSTTSALAELNLVDLQDSVLSSSLLRDALVPSRQPAMSAEPSVRRILPQDAHNTQAAQMSSFQFAPQQFPQRETQKSLYIRCCLRPPVHVPCELTDVARLCFRGRTQSPQTAQRFDWKLLSPASLCCALG